VDSIRDLSPQKTQGFLRQQPLNRPEGCTNFAKVSKKPGHPHCPSCPCKQTGLDTALPSHDGEHKQFQTRSSAERPIDAWTGDATSLSVAVRTDSPGLERGLALPFLSAHDLLTTFHILRC
jgi:hypothetical protein